MSLDLNSGDRDTCSECGKPVAPTVHREGKRPAGRPRKTCSDECRDARTSRRKRWTAVWEKDRKAETEAAYMAEFNAWARGGQ